MFLAYYVVFIKFENYLAQAETQYTIHGINIH